MAMAEPGPRAHIPGPPQLPLYTFPAPEHTLPLSAGHSYE